MIVKPPEEAESRLVSLTHSGIAGGKAVGAATVAAGRSVRKGLLKFYLGLMLFGLVAALLQSAFAPLLLLGAVFWAVHWYRGR